MGSIAYSQGQINFKDLNSAKYYKGSDAYSQSKLALVLFNMELSKRLEGMECPFIMQLHCYLFFSCSFFVFLLNTISCMKERFVEIVKLN